MKRALIVAIVLLTASISYAFNVGDRVIVIDVNSPYHLAIGKVTAVHHRHHHTVEIDTVLIASGPSVHFTSDELKTFINIPPRK